VHDESFAVQSLSLKPPFRQGMVPLIPQLLLQALVVPGQQVRLGTEQLFPSVVPLQGRVPLSPQLLLHDRSPQQVFAVELPPKAPLVQVLVPGVPQLFSHAMVWPGQQVRMGTEQADHVVPLHDIVPFSPQLLLHAASPQHVLATEQAP
jgi:hypothetical protein